jgi:hypothetical protein
MAPIGRSGLYLLLRLFAYGLIDYGFRQRVYVHTQSSPLLVPHAMPVDFKLDHYRICRCLAFSITYVLSLGVFVLLDSPGRIAGRPRVQETYSISFANIHVFPDIGQRLSRLGADSVEDSVHIKALDLAKFLAKIAHAFAIAELGVGVFEELYVAHLIDSDKDYSDWNYWIGSYDRRVAYSSTQLHELEFLQRGDDLSVILHLLAPLTATAAHG